MIRLFRKDDAQQCQDIIYEHLNYYATDLAMEAKDHMRETMTLAQLIGKSEQGYWLVAEQDGVVGMAVLDSGEIKHVFVAKKMQGKGIGKMLLENLEIEARNQNQKRLFLSSARNAIAFYLKFGFHVVNENNIWIGTIRIDQVLMEKILSSGGSP